MSLCGEGATDRFKEHEFRMRLNEVMMIAGERSRWEFDLEGLCGREDWSRG